MKITASKGSTGMFGIPSKSTEDNSDEHIQIVRKSEAPLSDLLSLTGGRVDNPLGKEEWEKMKMLIGIQIDLQGSMIELFNEVIENKTSYEELLSPLYIPLVYKIYEYAQRAEMPKEHKIKLTKNFSARTLVSEFNYVYKETYPFLKKHFTGIDYEEEIIRLFSQSYVANFIAIEEQLRLIREETT